MYILRYYYCYHYYYYVLLLLLLSFLLLLLLLFIITMFLSFRIIYVPCYCYTCINAYDLQRLLYHRACQAVSFKLVNNNVSVCWSQAATSGRSARSRTFTRTHQDRKVQHCVSSRALKLGAAACRPLDLTVCDMLGGNKPLHKDASIYSAERCL